jgi:hypothetical protein
MGAKLRTCDVWCEEMRLSWEAALRLYRLGDCENWLSRLQL